MMPMGDPNHVDVQQNQYQQSPFQRRMQMFQPGQPGMGPNPGAGGPWQSILERHMAERRAMQPQPGMPPQGRPPTAGGEGAGSGGAYMDQQRAQNPFRSMLPQAFQQFLGGGPPQAPSVPNAPLAVNQLDIGNRGVPPVPPPPDPGMRIGPGGQFDREPLDDQAQFAGGPGGFQRDGQMGNNIMGNPLIMALMRMSGRGGALNF